MDKRWEDWLEMKTKSEAWYEEAVQYMPGGA